MTRPARRENALLELAHIRVARRMWAAITLSSLGDWLGLLATTALAGQLTNSQSVATQGFAISGVLLVRLAPDLVFGPLAAAVADKWDRRRTAIIAQTTAAVLYASIAAGHNHLLWLYIAQFLIEAAGLFNQPAMQVMQVSIVPKRLLATANQISLISVYGSVPIASAVFALLSSLSRVFDGSHAANDGNSVTIAIIIALLLDSVSYLVSAATVFLNRHDIPVVPAEREREQGIFSLLREGVSFVRRSPIIRGLYVGIIGAFAAGGLTVGVAQLWVKTLSAGAAGYSIMFGAVFTGLALGMLLGPRVLPSFPRTRVFALAIGGAGITLLIMSLMRDLILATGLAALVGAFAGIAWIIGYTLIGQEVEERLRGRIFAFVLSSVRLTLLAMIALGPILAGAIGTHRVHIRHSVLDFTGPGLTLLLGGIVALTVSLYTAAQSGRGSRTRVRDLVRRGIVRTGTGRFGEHSGLFVTVDGVDVAATQRYAALIRDELVKRRITVVATAEPSDSPTGRRVRELDDAGIEAETAALLSAADRAEHVATVIQPALERGEAVVCDRFVLSSLARHGGERGADVDRIRSVNSWSTGGLTPDLTVVVDVPADDTGQAGARQPLQAAVDAEPDRFIGCPAPAPDALAPELLARLDRVLKSRAPLLREQPPDPADQPVSDPAGR